MHHRVGAQMEPVMKFSACTVNFEHTYFKLISRAYLKATGKPFQSADVLYKVLDISEIFRTSLHEID